MADRNRWRNLSNCIDQANQNAVDCRRNANNNYNKGCNQAKDNLDQKLAEAISHLERGEGECNANLQNCLDGCGRDTTGEYPIKGAIPDCDCEAGYASCIQQMEQRYGEESQNALDEYAKTMTDLRDKLAQDMKSCDDTLNKETDKCWNGEYDIPGNRLTPRQIISSLITTLKRVQG